MKVLVVGSRNFNDYSLLKSTLDNLLVNATNIEIISGGARGADTLAEKYAKDNGYQLKVFLADWNRYGKSAGYKRNYEMHKYISEFNDRLCVAFWDGQSKGTAHNFELSKQFNTSIKIIKYMGQ